MKIFLCFALIGGAVLGTVSAGAGGVCVVDGVTYNPRDPIPNNDPCKECVCDPEQPDQQRCAVIACAAPLCGACGLKTSPGACCPSCKPECVINNVTYCEGDVVSNATCETCTCAPDAPNQQICLGPPCSFITDCGGFDLVTPPGECCPKCPKCDVVGPGYKPGDKLSIPGRDPCSFNCFCDGNGRTACTLIVVTCLPTFCFPGTKAVVEKIPGECCDNVTCVPVGGCEVNGTKYAPGASVPSDDPCRVGCFCDGSTGEAVCAIVDCFLFECPDGQRLKYLPGQCCPICVTDYTNCSFQFCKKKRKALCTKIDAVADCTCNVTSCMAAYYSKDERPAPAECSRTNKCAGLTGKKLEKCLRKWGKCVKDAFKDQYGKTRGKLRKKRFFKTLEYPCSG